MPLRSLALPVLALLSTTVSAQPGLPDRLVLNADQAQRAGIVVETARAATQGELLALQGTVVAPPQAGELVSAPLAGVVQAVQVLLADAVRPGQVVVRLHSPALAALQREYLQLRLQAEQAHDRLQRDVQLAADGVIAEARLHESRSTQQQARLGADERRQSLRLAGLSEAQIQQLVQTLAVQPLLQVQVAAAGRVAEVLVQPGQQVEAGAPLLRLARPVPLTLLLQATPAQALQVRAGDGVQLADCPLTGKVSGQVPAMQGSNQAVLVQVRLDRVADCATPNRAVLARVQTAAPAAAAQRVPTRAIWQLDGRDQVFVKTPVGYQARAVKVLARDAGLATLAGLPAGAQVVTAGVAALKGAWMRLGDTVPTAARPLATAAAGSR